MKPAVADIADAAAVGAAFKGFGEVHVLINNAGVSRYPTLASTDPDGWSEDIASNLNGAYHLRPRGAAADGRAALGQHRQCRLGQRPLGAGRSGLQRRQGRR